MDPAEVGLPGTGRRRTPGLRREEVAALSGVGVAWYTWLEQGRVETSRQVLDAVSRALRLDADAHRHVLALAGLRPEPGSGVTPTERAELVERLRGLLDAWPTTPALLVDARFDILAWNDAYRAVWPDPGLTDVDQRNFLLLLVSDPVMRQRLPDWRTLAKEMFWQLRATTDRCPGDRRLGEVLTGLDDQRPDLAPWWRGRTVREFRGTTLAVHVPDGSQPRLTFSLLRPTEEQAVSVLVQAPADEPSRRWLADLAQSAGLV